MPQPSRDAVPARKAAGTLALSSPLLPLTLVCLAQVFVAGYGGDRHFMWLIWASVATFAAACLSVPALLRDPVWRSHLPYLIGPSLAIAWLLLAQRRAMAPEFALASTWVWCGALLLVPVARHAWQAGLALPFWLALVLPGGLFALWRGFISLSDPAGQMGTMVDPNLLADRIVLVLLLALACTAWMSGRAHDGRAAPGVYIGLLLLAAVAALLVHQGLNARAGMVLLIAVSVTMALVQQDRRLWAVPALMLVVFALPWLFPEWANFRARGGVVGVGQLGALGDLGAGSVRQELREAAVTLLSGNWIAGLGFGAFVLLYPTVRSATDSTFGVLVHNDWLQLLLEGGLPLFLGVIALALACGGYWARSAWRLAVTRDLEGPVRSTVIVGNAMLVGVGAVLLHAFINFPLFDPTLLNVTLASAVLGISITRTSGSAAPLTAASALPRAVPLVAGAMLVAIGMFWLQAAAHGVALMTMTDSRAPFPGTLPPELSAEERMRWAQRLQRWGIGYGMPAFVQAHSIAILGRERGGLPKEVEAIAEGQFEEALARGPWTAEFYVQYSRFLRDTGRAPLERRLEIIHAGLDRAPLAPRLWLAAAYHRDLEGAWEPAAAALAEQWFRSCTFAFRSDPEAAEGFFQMIPPTVLEQFPEAAAHCRMEQARLANRATSRAPRNPLPPRCRPVRAAPRR